MRGTGPSQSRLRAPRTHELTGTRPFARRSDLVKDTVGVYDEKVNRISTILQNMHHLCNVLRPVQV